MELYFLGTGAGMPSRKRNVTSVALRLNEGDGTVWLFDCGEGTQQQLLKSPIRMSKLDKVFVTHLHGDHLYGIPGLLTSRSYQGGNSPLQLFGPPGIAEFVETALRLSAARLDYELDVIEYEEGVIWKDARYSVSAAKLEHRIDSYGFRIVERDQPGKLEMGKLAALGVRPGPICAKLKRGENVVLEDGTLLKGADFVGPPTKGRIVTILGDTRICDTAATLAADADVLVHEATFDRSLQALAHKYYHSTTAEAAAAAAESHAKALILTHFSSRYQEEDAEWLLEEARAIHPNTYLAEDFWSFPVPKPGGSSM